MYDDDIRVRERAKLIIRCNRLSHFGYAYPVDYIECGGFFTEQFAFHFGSIQSGIVLSSGSGSSRFVFCRHDSTNQCLVC